MKKSEKSKSSRGLIALALASFMISGLNACGGGSSDKGQQTAVTPTPTADTLADAAYEPIVQQLYVGYFGRPADPAGLARYTAAYRSAGAPKTAAELNAAYGANAMLRNLIDSFDTSQESAALYPSSDYIGDDYTFIFAVNNNLFSRDPDIDFAATWATKLNQHQATRAQAVLAIMASAVGRDADIVAAKTNAARKFTATLNASGRGDAFLDPVSQAVTRSMLQGVSATTGVAALQSMIDDTVGALIATANGQFTDEQGTPRKIALVAAPDQIAPNGSRLAALASTLAADLNGLRAKGPVWGVDVITAASTVVAVRDQLKPYQGAILIGNVPIPTSLDLGSGTPAPALDPYRTPYCSAFQFTASGNDLANNPQLTTIDPACRNGLIISELRGRSATTQLSDVATLLDRMIAYHSASQALNSNWTKSYRFIQAGWYGGTVLPDVTQAWNDISMYAQNMISYLTDGTGSSKRSAFIDCISKNNEMCIFDGHGAPSSILFEGPGTPGMYYSADSVDFDSGAVAPASIKAKYISLVSCSTQNFINDGSLGTTLLTSGDALLTHGMVSVAGISSHYEEETIKSAFSVLSKGGTFADAYFGKMEYTPENFQGDPYITMRPVPNLQKPMLVIDGKHYNETTMVLPVVLPDSVDGMKATKVLSLSNRGNTDMHLYVRLTPSDVGVGYGASSQGEPEYGMNAGFTLASISQSAVSTIIRGGPDQMLTVRPGASVALTYALTPNPQRQRNGNFSGRFEIRSDDPAAARLILEVRGTVR